MEFNYDKCPECGYIDPRRPNQCSCCGWNLAAYRQRLHEQELAEQRRLADEQAMAAKEAAYKAAVELLCNGQHKEALVAFLVIGDFKDSLTYAEQARERLYNAYIKEFAEDALLSILYTPAAERKIGNHEGELRTYVSTHAIYHTKLEEKFGELHPFRETEKYIVACKQAADEFLRVQNLLQVEAQEAEEQRKAAEAERIRAEQDAAKREAALQEKYKKGKKHLEDGSFREAIEIFAELGDYQDAAALYDTALNKMYKRAVSLKTKQQYQEAMEIFAYLGDYADADKQFADTRELMYLCGQTLIEEQKYETAVKFFRYLGDYKDSPALLAKAKPLLEEQKKTEAAQRAKAWAKQKKKAKCRLVFETILSLLLLAGIVIGILYLFRSCTAANVTIVAVDKIVDTTDTQHDKGLVSTFVFEVTNNGHKEIMQIEGNMKVYNNDDTCLFSDVVTLNGTISPGNTMQFTLTLDLIETNNIREMYVTQLDGLKITYQISSITYEGYDKKTYKNPEELLLHEAETDYTPAAVGDHLQEEFDSMLTAFRSADEFGPTPTYVADLNAAVDRLNCLFADIKAHDKLQEALYEEAVRYQDVGNHEKAYYLFSTLEIVSYKDSALRSDVCYENAGTMSYNPAKPGKTGLVFDYDTMVVATEEGYDAADFFIYGDNIVEIDGQRIITLDDVYAALEGKRAGDTIEIGFYRYTSYYMTATIKLGYKYF